MIPAAESMLAEALFCSDLQPSQHPTFGDVCNAVNDAFDRHGPDGCAAVLAQEAGDHPAAAAARMRWARATVAAAYHLSSV